MDGWMDGWVDGWVDGWMDGKIKLIDRRTKGLWEESSTTDRCPHSS